jgi:hypothetical protein
MPENITLDQIITVISVVAFLASLAANFLQARKAGKTVAEALTLMINTLKVESKMLPDGTLDPALIAKAEKAAEVLQVGQQAKVEVTKALQGQHVNDLKVASINGKPIYLGQIAGVGGALAAALRKVKGIRLRL